MHITLEQYNLFTWLWMGLGVSIFILLLFITAPYGRHTKTTWGPLINNKLGWFIMEITLIGVLAFFVCIGHNKQSLVNWIIVGLITFHYLNRSLLFPLRIRTGYKKMPVLIMFMGVFFNIINGFLFGYYLAYFKVYPTNWMMSPQFIIGAIIFIGLTLMLYRKLTIFDWIFLPILNLYINIYPIFLQRYNRIRIIKVLKNNGQPSPYEIYQ